jgi:hypothetical protein
MFPSHSKKNPQNPPSPLTVEGIGKVCEIHGKAAKPYVFANVAVFQRLFMA